MKSSAEKLALKMAKRRGRLAEELERHGLLLACDPRHQETIEGMRHELAVLRAHYRRETDYVEQECCARHPLIDTLTLCGEIISPHVAVTMVPSLISCAPCLVALVDYSSRWLQQQ